MKIAILLNLKANYPCDEEEVIDLLEKYEEFITKCPCEEYYKIIHRILNKNTCSDLFKDIKIGNEFMYPRFDKSLQVKWKFREANLRILLKRINLFINFGSFRKVYLITAILRRLEIIKELFINEI